MKKKLVILVCFFALCIAKQARCDLMVYEDVPGERVAYDTETNLYWYCTLTDFANRTYAEQIEAIADLGTYGNITGGWHMASEAEIAGLLANDGLDLAAFPPTLSDRRDPHYPSDEVLMFWFGRTDVVPAGLEGPHLCLVGYAIEPPYTDVYPVVLGIWIDSVSDNERFTNVGAWVVSGGEVVPAPGALILGVTGLLSSTLGLKRLRRKHQE